MAHPLYEMLYKDIKGVCPYCLIKGPQNIKKRILEPQTIFMCDCTLPKVFLLRAGKRQFMNEVLASWISTESSFFIAKIAQEKHQGRKL